tara:strand:+ start:970 stop:1149 length:180 start_codon:yes stop_codon:yes gene_type:complete
MLNDLLLIHYNAVRAREEASSQADAEYLEELDRVIYEAQSMIEAHNKTPGFINEYRDRY